MPRRVDRPDRVSEAAISQEAVLPLAAIALRLLENAGKDALIYIAADERRAETIGGLLQRLAPTLETLVLPPWDCLPLDRASPSRESMGRRMAVLRRLGNPAPQGRIVVTTIEAALQRLPPPAAASRLFFIRTGEPLDLDGLKDFAARTGYGSSDRVDEPGQIEFHGQVVEVFRPEDREPVRIELAEGTVTDMHRFDPMSQRSRVAIPELALEPASEIVFGPNVETLDRPGGFEHGLARFYEGNLTSLFDAMDGAVILAAPGTEARRRAFLESMEEADAVAGPEPGRPADTVARVRVAWRALYLDDAAWQGVQTRHEERNIVGSHFKPVPNFAAESRPVHVFQSYVEGQLAEGRRVVLAGVRRDLSALARYLDRHGGTPPIAADHWAAVTSAPPGTFFGLDLDLEEGIVDDANRITLVAAADVLGTRAHRSGDRRKDGRSLLLPPTIRIGDTVIHEDHGIGVLRDLEPIEIDGQRQDAARLEFHGGDSLLMPVTDFDKLWRYGSDDDAVTLDRLHTDAWTKRRIGVVKAMINTADHLVGLAREREAQAAPKLVAPHKAYEAFAARFAFPETPDQARAIKAVIEDLASGRPMDRLICGDVGFGKTEVALRAAAVALFSGKQVAVVAPTTVLARQHLQTFRKRFAGFKIEIAGLSRLDGAADARRVKQGLADGSIDLVIGTHAVAGQGVEFADLGLMIIDEEQKFGAKIKLELRAKAEHGHVMTMTATPIPRTLQMAMVGIQAVSVIATPPVRRRPIRTFVSVFDAAAVRAALKREQARGGQSFVIVPRIEDIGLMQARLAEIVPDLEVRVAHGDLPAEEADQAMVGFARGEGDILLATNIVESGLDVPRANTMLVWHADRFGLSQLHQLRGRVGRGRAQGVAYLLSDPDTRLSGAAEARLATLQSFDRLGSGFEISARDLDMRGAGDLVGDDQAGHLRLIGLELYQNLLGRAIRAAKGETLADDAPPEVHLGRSGHVPESYVAEPDLRIDLYARLSRFETAKEILGFEEEVEDRFGTPPEEIKALFALARARVFCRRLGIVSLSAGPRGVAVTFRPEGLPSGEALARSRDDMTMKGSKLVWTVADGNAGGDTLFDVLAELEVRSQTEARPPGR